MVKYVKELYGKLLAGSRVWQLDAPGKVFSAVWKNSNAVYIHLFNQTGVTINPGDKLDPLYPAVPYPAITEDMSFVLDNVKKGAKAVAVSPDFAGRVELKSSWKNGKLFVQIPAKLLKTYTIVTVK